MGDSVKRLSKGLQRWPKSSCKRAQTASKDDVREANRPRDLSKIGDTGRQESDRST